MSNLVVLITGVSRGLGAALVHSFVTEGYSVCGLSRDSDGQIQFEDVYSKDQYLGVVADVGEPDEVRQAINKLFKQYGRIDIVFNNAAVYPKINFVAESAEDFISALVTNVGGITNVCKAVLPLMIQQKSGKIYNLGSWADLNPAADSAVYSASKGSIHSLTRAIAKDIAPLNLDIEIHEWIPGHLNTRMSAFTGIDPSVSSRWATQIVNATPTSKNSVFENNYEWLEPESLRQRVFKILTGQKLLDHFKRARNRNS